MDCIIIDSIRLLALHEKKTITIQTPHISLGRRRSIEVSRTRQSLYCVVVKRRFDLDYLTSRELSIVKRQIKY